MTGSEFLALLLFGLIVCYGLDVMEKTQKQKRLESRAVSEATYEPKKVTQEEKAKLIEEILANIRRICEI